MNLDGVFKSHIKEAILGSLATEKPSLRNQIATLIATIASIEIPRHEWTELIANLC